MFHGSTHKKHWIFPNLEEVNKLRRKCNEDFASKHSIAANDLVMLEEQMIICHYYEQKLFQLCKNFKPALPYSVLFTAFTYLKRIYLQTSIAQNHPINMLSVCLYMACKVEEYNLSVDKFVCFYPEEDRENVADVIISNEMNLMKVLNYHLIVHSPIRAMEGFLIDLKTRFPQNEDPERHREAAIEFLNALLFTDAAFLYPPSQLALAALYTASKKTVHDYILSVLALGEQGKILLEKINDIVSLVNKKLVYEYDRVKQIQEKLQQIRIQGKARKRKIVSPAQDESAKQPKILDSKLQEEDDMATEMP